MVQITKHRGSGGASLLGPISEIEALHKETHSSFVHLKRMRKKLRLLHGKRSRWTRSKNRTSLCLLHGGLRRVPVTVEYR